MKQVNKKRNHYQLVMISDFSFYTLKGKVWLSKTRLANYPKTSFSGNILQLGVIFSVEHASLIPIINKKSHSRLWCTFRDSNPGPTD